MAVDREAFPSTDGTLTLGEFRRYRNGSSPDAISEPDNVSSVEPDDETIVTAPPRTCDRCGGPLKPRQERFCSLRCKDEAFREGARLANERARRWPRGGPSDELGHLVAAVFDAGAVLELELAGVRVVARR